MAWLLIAALAAMLTIRGGRYLRREHPGAVLAPGQWRWPEAVALAALVVLLLVRVGVRPGPLGLAAAAVGLAVWLAWTRLFGTAAVGIVTAAVLFLCGWQHYGLRHREPEPREPPHLLRFVSDDPADPDTELWVNDVCLGTLPVTLTPAEFLARVPVQRQPPADVVAKPRRIDAVPAPYRYADDSLRPGVEIASGRYARLRVDGCPALVYGPDRTLFRHRERIVFHPVVLGRRERLQRLFAQAALRDLAVDDAWLAALDTYAHDAVNVLRERAAGDARLLPLRAAWGRHRYDLDGPPAAAFAAICTTVDRQGWYDSAGPAAAAIRQLAPRLPTAATMAMARELWTPGRELTVWQSADFGMPYYLAPPDASWFRMRAARDPEPGDYPPHALAVAQALWEQHRAAVAAGVPYPTPVQAAVGEFIVRRQRDNPWRAASLAPLPLFGGPALDRYLQVEDARRPALYPEYWPDLRASLRDAAGEAFRRERAADLVVRARGQFRQLPEWVFLDPYLARCVWPHYARAMREQHKKSPGQALAAQFEYLVRLGDAATPQMYVAAWEDTPVEVGPYLDVSAFRLLERLPVPRRREIRAAIFATAKAQPIVEQIVRGTIPTHGPYDPELLLDDLRHGRRQQIDRTVFARWLHDVGAVSGVVELLAAAPEADLRVLALAGIEGHPSPERRELLAGLLADPDSEVRTAAARTRAYLDELAATPPAALAAGAMEEE